MTQYMTNQPLTDKQYKILIVLCHGSGKDENGKLIPCDLNELLERLAYRTTKASMQFSIRALISRKLISKEKVNRRGALRVTYIPSRVALQMMGYQDPSYVEDMDFSALDV